MNQLSVPIKRGIFKPVLFMCMKGGISSCPAVHLPLHPTQDRRRTQITAGMNTHSLTYIYVCKKAQALYAGLLWLGRPAVLFYALPYLMALLSAGTLAQKELGLYQAQHLFFSAWVLWVGPLPLPGSYMVLTLIFIALCVKFLLASPWRRAHAGIILTHLGVLFLLLGGVITALSARESVMVIPEGQARDYTSAYHDRVLAVEIKTDNQDSAPIIATYPLDHLKQGQTLTPDGTGLTVAIDKTCRHCTAQLAPDDAARIGLAAKMDLIPAPLEKEDEMNLSGITFTVSGAGDDQNGTYISLEDVPLRPEITRGDTTYTLYVRRARMALPFAIYLKDFAQDLYPGTAMARAYHSDVIVRDNGVEWPARIEMNEPLRYKGYTFYQSSFSIGPNGEEKTVLSVVRNAGRAFPYVASAIILIGLLLHLFIRLRAGAQKDAS